MSEERTADLAELDDTALIEWRNQIREQLEHEPPNMADLVRAHYLLTTEVVGRTIAMRKKRRKRELPSWRPDRDPPGGLTGAGG
jgi:hypothetical protein